jgi:amino-acid N-acetyltransferase
MLRLADLREILRYVPQYRDKIFVIALDGVIVEEGNFRNLLLDIALLRSLRVEVALVHGAGYQIGQLAEQTGQKASNIDGTGVTDFATLQLALNAANRVTHEILEGLSATDLHGACGNALVAHPAGILQGIDHLHTGKVDRVDEAFIRALMERDVIPVIPPLGIDGEGNTFRLNSDAVAVEVALALHAVKLIYLTSAEGVTAGGELLRQLTVEEADALLKANKSNIAPVSKLVQAVRAARYGVPRVHIIDGRVEEGLLAEVFSNEGIGTLVYTNEYQAIRKARKKDARAIFHLIQSGVEHDELVKRSLLEIDRQIDDFFVFDVDGNQAGCIALHAYTDGGMAEMACVCVSPKYENQGIGGRLMHFIEDQARTRGFKSLFCLSTQAVNYFVQKGGFQLGSPDDLPAPRRERYDKSGRRSQVLVKKLAPPQ